jgi:Dolichyl-phosphate-mannose-protein mannosyltransferase
VPKQRTIFTLGGALFALALMIYGALLAEVALGHLRHRAWVVLVMRYVLLLPAVILILRFRRGTASSERIILPPARVVVGVFLAVALLLSWQTKQGITISDESAYRFQAKIFSAGRLWAVPLPGATDSGLLPSAVSFANHILRPDRWFAKYPPGWPLLLALPERFHLAWLTNPLLGTLLLWLIFRLGKSFFDQDSAKLAVLLASLSPYVLAYSTGYMAHASCAAAVAGSVLAMIRGLRTSAILWVVISFSLLVYACMTRPFTGVVSLCLILAFGIWSPRDQPRLRRAIFLIGIGASMLAILLTLAYNKIYTGSYWLSPYALNKGVSVPKEITLNPRLIFQHLFLTRWSLEGTFIYTFPFVFLLGAYAAAREWKRDPNVRFLGVFFPALVIAHLVQTENSASFIGERYYFEGFFAVVLLAARGLVILLADWKPSNMAIRGVTAGFILLQMGHVGLGDILIRQHSAPYRRAAALAQDLPAGPYVVFFAGQDDGPTFVPKRFNLNGVNWQSEAQVFLVDPGVEQRAMWARFVGRQEWAVIGSSQYNEVTIEQLGSTSEATPQMSSRIPRK